MNDIEQAEIDIEEAELQTQIAENNLRAAKESLVKARLDPHKENIEEIQEIMHDSSGVKVKWNSTQELYAIEFIPEGPMIQFYAWETIRQLMKKYKLHGIKQNCGENLMVYVRKHD